MNQPGIAKRLREYLENSETIMAKKLSDYIKRSELEESSIEVLVRAVVWFDEMNEGIEPSKVEYGHVDDFRSWLKKGRAGSTANTYMAMTKGFFGWMHRRGHIQTDPFDGVRRFVVEDKKFAVYTPEENRRIMKIADLRWRTIVCLALCSMRRAEILNLHVSDIDFERNEIYVKAKKKSENTWSWSIKGKNQGLIGIDDTIAQMLMKLIEELEDKRQPYIILKKKYWLRNLERQEAGTLTHTLRNNPWGNFDRDFKELLRRARVPYKRFHDNRVTFATERYNDGFELIDLKRLMRHSSIQTTERYIQKINERKLIKKSAGTFKKYYGANVP